MKLNNELVILGSLPKHIGYVCRDENNDLWASSLQPDVIESSQGGFIISFQPEDTGDHLHSLSVFNHLFNEIKPLSVMQLAQNFEEEK